MVKSNNEDVNKSKKACPQCGYDYQEDSNNGLCPICLIPMVDVGKKNIDEARILKNTHNSSLGHKPISSKKSFSSIINRSSHKWKSEILPSLNLIELQKPINLVGLFIFSIGITWWINHLWVVKPNQDLAKLQQLQTENTSEQTKTKPIPKGLFNYGGAPIFAPIVASGINGRIEKKYSGYELRYAKPFNGDYSSYNGIKMLNNGELSFAYNERPLNESEYKAAKLRNFNLKQIPIAIDGIVFYGNRKLNAQGLNQQQLRQIFVGEIDNWNQINPDVADLPIVPIVVENEDLRLLGINREQQKLPNNALSVANYTLALRKVIATPGAISFASGAIVKNQQFIEILALADGGSSDYVSPIDDGKLNITAFKSGKYPLTRRIFIVLREDGTLDFEAGMLYTNYLLSAEGQEIIKDAGLVKIVNHAEKINNSASNQ